MSVINRYPSFVLKGIRQAIRIFIKNPVIPTINHFLSKIGAINEMVACSFKLPKDALVFDHFEFHASTKSAHAETVETLKQSGYKFLMVFTGEGAPRTVFAIPGTKLSVAICESEPLVDYSGKPKIFLEHIGFVLKDEKSFSDLFNTAKKRFTKAAGNTTISKCVHPATLIAATTEINESSPLFRLIIGLNSIEFLDKNPAEILKPKSN